MTVIESDITKYLKSLLLVIWWTFLIGNIFQN